jgi:YD repeat-containing protein
VNTERRPARRDLRQEYDASARLTEIHVPPSESLAPFFGMLEAARDAESRKDLGKLSQELLDAISRFYGVAAPNATLLGVRPHRTLEGLLASELFGDYRLEDARIRLWTRTAIQKKWTSSRTLLSTLCHEFMHHLDVSQLGFPRSYHTTGFFERTHRLYLGVTGQPHYSLAWRPPEKDGSCTIDWSETNRRKTFAGRQY